MRLYFIRHGQSVNNALHSKGLNQEEIELQRDYDPQLTEIGFQQADLVGDFIRDGIDMPTPEPEPFALTKLYVSPMIRALNTAKPIAEACGLQPEVWTDIFEIGGLFKSDTEGNITNYPGLARKDFAAQYPGYILPDDVTDDGWWDANHGSEKPEEFMSRAIKVAIRLRKLAPTSERVAIVAHAGFLDSLIKAFLSQLPTHPNNLFYGHYNTGITRIDFAESTYSTAPDHIRIHYMNRVDHLPPELRTW